MQPAQLNLTPLTLKLVSEADIDDSGQTGCSVCMTEYEKWNEVAQLACRHLFHINCIYEWMAEVISQATKLSILSYTSQNRQRD